jgi:histidine kinase
MFDCGVAKRIFQGPRSLVYRACRNADGAPVIIKVPTPRSSRAERVRDLQGEAAILHRLAGIRAAAHPCGVARSGDDVALITHDRGGLSIRSLGLAGNIDIEHYLALARRLVDALEAIHARGVIHNDISPDHVVVAPGTFELELVGFSRSLLVEELYGPMRPGRDRPPGPEQTYTSPEQTGRLNRTVDFRSDYYLLGLTLFELLTGAPPFQSADPLALVHAHLARTPSDPRESRAAVPEGLSRVLLKLLAKDADDRYQNPRSLRRDLERCREARLATEPSLPVATRAFGGRLRLPERLYGRDDATARLSGALESALRGKTTLVTVSGPVGVGKSTLIRRVLDGVPKQGGLVLAGKFEPSQMPYAGLRRALDNLVSATTAELDPSSPSTSSAAATLGEHMAGVLTDFHPPLERLFGTQRNLPRLPPRQAGTRLSQALGRLLAVIAETKAPVCLFLDDLHWAGADSIALLRELLCVDLPGQLLIVLAYRDPADDVPPVGATLLEGLSEAIAISSLALRELAETEVRAFVTDALAMDEERSNELARVIFARTRGNPFFVRSFLSALHADGALERGASGWEFDLELVNRRGFTDNMVDLLLQRIAELPRSTQQALEQAALLGSRFDLGTLNCVAARPTADDLAVALDQELVLAVDVGVGGAEGAASTDHFQFAHDRVQQAVLQRVSEATQATLHLEIGQRLLAARGPHLDKQDLFDIVYHLNRATQIIGPSMLTEVAALNREAARTALAEGAGILALQLASEGCSMLGNTAWATDYELTQSLHQIAAEAAFGWADHEAFERVAERALLHARTPIDRVKILRLEGRVYQAQAKASEALKTYRKALAELDTDLPDVEETGAVLRSTAQLLEPYDIEALAHLPECTEPRVALAMELLSKLVFFAYSSANPMLPLVVCQLVTLSVTHGNTSESANGYTFYGRLLVAEGDLDRACRFGQLALSLVHRFSDPAMLSQTYLYANFQLMHWKVPLGELVSNFERAVEYGLQAGSPLNAAASATTLSICRFWAGDPLPALSRAMAAQRPLMARFRQRLVLQWHDALARAVHSLADSTEDCGESEASLNDERQRLSENANSPSALFNHYVWRMLVCYVFGDVEGALAASESNEPLKPAFMPALWAIPVTYVECLCQLAGAAGAVGEARERLLSHARSNCEKLERWVVHNPTTVEPKLLTVRAELASVVGNLDEAGRLFEEATVLAERGGAPAERGIAYELAARFSQSRHDRVTARARMRACQRAYFGWGAVAKARALERAYPDLLPQTLSQTARVTEHREAPHQFDTLDLLSVVNANRLISSEVKTQALLARLMSLLIESAGAELGYLLLNKRSGWVIEAGQSANSGTFTVLESVPVPELSSRGFAGAAASVIEHVSRTGTAVLVDDACVSEFARDEHIAEQPMASVLCFPMKRAGELIALVYLENNLARGAFTASSVAILEMLSMQAIISLENANLYESLEQKVEERTRQLRAKNEELAGALARVVEVQRQMVSQEKLAELGALAAGIAHEIKNPLNFITNFAVVASGLAEEIEAVASTRPLDAADPNELRILIASFQQATGKIREHGARATGIINGMALHARPGGGRHELVDLNQVLGQSVVLAAHGLNANGVSAQVVTDYDPLIGPVEIVAQDISRVVVNLISNARYSLDQKHRRGTRFVPEIRLTSRDQGENAQLSVRDNGLGIPALLRERIFLPFFTTKPAGEGTGLGLSISHDIIVRGHHGSIRVDSVDGEYAEFTIMLPKRRTRSRLAGEI